MAGSMVATKNRAQPVKLRQRPGALLDQPPTQAGDAGEQRELSGREAAIAQRHYQRDLRGRASPPHRLSTATTATRPVWFGPTRASQA